MVTLSIKFIKKEHLIDYRIESVEYYPKDYRVNVKLVNYFKGMPDLWASVRYFELLKQSMAMIHTTSVMYRITTNAQDYLEILVVRVADHIRANIEGDSKNAEENKRTLTSGSL